jgi:hypothetical protein
MTWRAGIYATLGIYALSNMVLHIDMLWFSIYWTGGHEGSAYFFLTTF